MQKIDEDTAIVAYPVHKEYGYPRYEKLYCVKSNILKNCTDYDD
jgi:hypothetical protein